jgi:alpha-L-arabinofuranosidase
MFAENQGTISLSVKIDNAPTIEAPYSSGCIGLGTWNNAAEFKDLKVISADGNVLFETDFSGNIDDWRKTGQGEWSVDDGVLKQSAIAPHITAFIGDTSWTDYTITLKARKLTGENGFQIYFRNKNNRQRIRWDLGGYWNSVHLLDIGVTSQSMKAGIEPGKWYDIKIDLNGSSAKGYLDGKLIQQVGDERTNAKSLCASASRDEKSGDIILKVVNADYKSLETQIDIKSAEKLTGNAKTIILTAESPLAENTLEEPTKVSPRIENVHFSGTTLTRSFPGYSLTIIRIPGSGKN